MWHVIRHQFTCLTKTSFSFWSRGPKAQVALHQVAVFGARLLERGHYLGLPCSVLRLSTDRQSPVRAADWPAKLPYFRQHPTSPVRSGLSCPAHVCGCLSSALLFHLTIQRRRSRRLPERPELSSSSHPSAGCAPSGDESQKSRSK